MTGRPLLAAVLVLGLLGLAACGGKHGAANGTGDGTDGTAALPKPEVSGGSVTGMPDKPGPGQIGVPDADTLSPDAMLPDTPVASDDGDLVAPVTDAATTPATVEPPSPGTPTDELPLPPGEPTPQDAVAVVRDYYGAIDAHDYAHAYALWSDGGRSSGKSPQQFADGFTDTIHVSAQTDAPSRVDAAAGSRYIEVPVTISATQRDGSVRRYAGTYTLRRAVVDGATAEQRAWRIASATMRDAD